MLQTRLSFTRRRFLTGAGSLSIFPLIADPVRAAPRYEVIVYGGTPSGVMAAFAAAREGLRVGLIIGPNPLGGMCANGLGWSDAPNQQWIGGLARDFFGKIAKAYGFKKIETQFEPHVAYTAFKSYITDAGIDLYANALATRLGRDGAKITSIVLSNGTVLAADTFVDASYEGDLMPLAGVSYAVGREAASAFNETNAGYNVFPIIRKYPVRDSAGRLLPEIKPYKNQQAGTADRLIQAYTFRLCLSNDPKNKAPWTAPPNYDADRFRFQASRLNPQSQFLAGSLHNNKFDKNGDQAGASWNYPDGTTDVRRAIWHDHYLYQAGLMYFYATDPRVPSQYRDQVNSFGLALDEFKDAGNWPRQLYIREARRLRGKYIFTQKDVRTELTKDDSIGVGSYSMDSHPTQLQATVDDQVNFEGTVPNPASDTDPFQIPYRILVPHDGEATNLLVSVCVSASHIGFAPLRLEPQYMMMGEAAGIAASLAVRNKSTVQAVNRKELQAKLKSYGAILST